MKTKTFGRPIIVILLVLVFCLGLIACDSEGGKKGTVTLSVHNSDTTVEIKVVESEDGEKYLFLPSGTKEEDLTFAKNEKLEDFTALTDENIGSLYFYSEDPKNQGIDYINGSIDHSAKAPGRVVLLDENLNLIYDGEVESIKGRGNRTWRVSDKKPYQIKLTEKANLVNPDDDSQAAKKWVLLANAFDTTLVRNQIAYSMAKELGLEESPDGRQVDLYYDGDYLGVYYLCEKVEIGEGRVEINDLEENPDVLTGGYLLEIDLAYFEDEKYYFDGPPAGVIVIKEPEEPTQEQMEYIENFFGNVMMVIENKGQDENGNFVLFDYLERDSALKYFLSMVWIGNEDSFFSSAYLYKPENEDKLYFGPVWDCDYSMGNGNQANYDEWNLRGKLGKKLLSIPEFHEALMEAYETEMTPLITDILLGENDGAYLLSFDTIKKEMAMPLKMNFTSLDVKTGSTRADQYEKALEQLENWLIQRKKWFEIALK